MARTLAVFRWLSRAVRREGHSYFSFSENNLFFAAVALGAAADPQALAAVCAVIALLLFLPASEDPLLKMPEGRLAAWPLSAGERWALRALSLALSPAAWAAAALAWWKGASPGVAAAAAGLFAAGLGLSRQPWSRCGRFHFPLPHIPGPVNQLYRKNLRELAATLDFWCAALVSGGALAFRLAGELPEEARLPIMLLALTALSTPARNAFSLDGREGLARYRLLPLPYGSILAAKDLAFLTAALALCLPLHPLAGVAGALAALAAGHFAPARTAREGRRWRFCRGGSFGHGLLQIFLIAAAGSAAQRWGWIALAGTAAVYAAARRLRTRSSEAFPE